MAFPSVNLSVQLSFHSARFTAWKRGAWGPASQERPPPAAVPVTSGNRGTVGPSERAHPGCRGMGTLAPSLLPWESVPQMPTPQDVLGTLAPGPQREVRAEPGTLGGGLHSPPGCPWANCWASLNSSFLHCKMEVIIKAPPEGRNEVLEKSGMLPGGGGGSRRGTRASWASVSLQVAFSTRQTLAVLDLHPACSKSSRRENSSFQANQQNPRSHADCSSRVSSL